MSIGIAVLLPDSTVLVADGRMRRFDAPGDGAGPLLIRAANPQLGPVICV
jgi:hypothetical protein